MTRIAIFFVVPTIMAASQVDPSNALLVGGAPVMEKPGVAEVFAGSSPCDESIRPLLQIPRGADAHLMEWKVTLSHNPQAAAPATYHLHYKYGLTVPGKPGLAPTARAMERRGSWRIATGTKRHPQDVVYELNGTVAL